MSQISQDARPYRPEPAYFDTPAASAFSGVSTSHLEKLRHFRADGPPYVKVGRRVLYPVDKLRAWMDSRSQGGGL
jgi:hypothetical protein